MAGGAFQTDREIFNKSIWKYVLKFRLFFFIYGNAVYAEEGTDIGGIHLERGQFLRSYRNLQEDLEYIENRAVKRYSLSQIKRTVDELIEEKRLKIESAELGTLFTVLNYEEYQGFERFSKGNLEGRKNSVGTALEQRWNNNKKDKKDKKILNTKVFNCDSLEFQSANVLKTLILKNNDTAKTPDDLQKWASGFDLIYRVDERNVDEVLEVLRYSQNDSFWKKNILSPDSLRKHYDRLKLAWQEWESKLIEKD